MGTSTPQLKAPEAAHLCVNYDIIEASPGDHLQSGCVGHVLDGDQVGQQPLHFATVPSSLRVPLRSAFVKHSYFTILNTSVEAASTCE